MDVAVSLLILITFAASLLLIFPMFTAKLSMDQTAKYIARTVELYGKADEDTINSVYENDNIMAPDSVTVDTEWENATEKTIQLKTGFTITVTKRVPITIMRPALGEPIIIYVTITSSANGISEVYWKK